MLFLVLKIVFLHFGLLRKHNLHADKKAAVTLRAYCVTGLAVGRVAVGKYIAGVKDIIDRGVENDQVALDALQLTGLNTHIMYRRRAVFQELFIIGIIVGPATGECVRRAKIGFGFFKPLFSNEADIMV